MVVLAVTALAACTSAPPPPAADPSRADYGTLMVECLRDAGYDASASGSGVTIASHPSQQSAVSDALAKCEESLGYADMGRLTDEQLKQLYALELKTQECLASLGYVTVLPSEQVFVDSYYDTETTFELQETQLAYQIPEFEDYETALAECPPASSGLD